MKKRKGTKVTPPEDVTLKGRVRVCEVLSGGLMECAGALRRVRWALDEGLTESMRMKLDVWVSELDAAAISAHIEAQGIQGTTMYALAGKAKP